MAPSERNTSQKLRLITQGPDVVMASTSEVPVIYLGSNKELGLKLVMAVNFLRSGCPSVQLVYRYSAYFERDAFEKQINQFLASLEVENDYRHEDLYCSPQSGPQGYFVTYIERFDYEGPRKE